MVAKKRKYTKHSGEEKLLIGFLLLLDVLIMGFLVFGNLKLYSENKEVKKQYFNLNQELVYLENKNRELKELFSYTNEDDYTEAILREKGMYQKQGEEVVVITRENPPQTELAQGNNQRAAQSASVWQKILDFFGGIFGRD
jgi:cell division protein FtsL